MRAVLFILKLGLKILAAPVVLALMLFTATQGGSVVANALGLVHNHPSGNELPSDEDKALTGRVDLAASLFDITLLDHIIVTAGPCYSFRSHGFFDKRPNP